MTLLTDIPTEEMQKVLMLIDNANVIITGYFGVRTSFDIVICHGSWEMEIQVISRRRELPLQYDDTKSIAITDYHLKEIIIRYDVARFGHYLHELIHGIISENHSQQLREGLAWYFTMKLTERCRYVRAKYPSWIDKLYLYPVKKLAQIIGDDFLKDFALGKGVIQEDALPPEVQDLFLPEEILLCKKATSQIMRTHFPVNS
ncbi:MAG: hypothetical protein WCF23_19115 [Candidatus Nitrosopolaris sp.]